MEGRPVKDPLRFDGAALERAFRDGLSLSAAARQLGFQLKECWRYCRARRLTPPREHAYWERPEVVAIVRDMTQTHAAAAAAIAALVGRRITRFRVCQVRAALGLSMGRAPSGEATMAVIDDRSHSNADAAMALSTAVGHPVSARRVRQLRLLRIRAVTTPADGACGAD
jgi:hypothetical protein